MGDNLTVILVVEDEALLQLALQDDLEEAGFAVETASTGDAALNALDERAHDIKCLVTDIQLGGKVDGWAVARHARELNPQLPIIYMSGDSSAQWASQGVSKSMMIEKPFVSNQMITAIGMLLNEVSSSLPQPAQPEEK